MLYQHKVTGGLVEKISQHGDGVYMVMNANDEVDYVHEDDLIPHLEATNEQFTQEEIKLGPWISFSLVNDLKYMAFVLSSLFSVNDKVVHTGFLPMGHYPFAIGVGKK